MNIKTLPYLLTPALLFSAGCFSPMGRLFTYKREPLSIPVERRGSPKASKECFVSLTQLKEPVTRLNLSVMWSNRIVQDAAAKAGITEIYYCDLETLSVFLDSYKRQRVYFYGD